MDSLCNDIGALDLQRGAAPELRLRAEELRRAPDGALRGDGGHEAYYTMLCYTMLCYAIL